MRYSKKEWRPKKLLAFLKEKHFAENFTFISTLKESQPSMVIDVKFFISAHVLIYFQCYLEKMNNSSCGHILLPTHILQAVYYLFDLIIQNLKEIVKHWLGLCTVAAPSEKFKIKYKVIRKRQQVKLSLPSCKIGKSIQNSTTNFNDKYR